LTVDVHSKLGIDVRDEAAVCALEICSLSSQWLDSWKR